MVLAPMENSLGSKDYTDLLSLAKKAVLLGGEVLLHRFGHLSEVNKKEKAGLVSEADIESEKVITEFLKKETPEIGILAEEAHFQGQKIENQQVQWVIDPLDGTTNYVHGSPLFCVSIGLQIGQSTVVGAINAPKMNQVFEAHQGGGAYLNGQKISVSERKEVEDCLLATGFFLHDEQSLIEQLKLFEKVISKCRGTRRFGAAAYDMCMVALGVFDGFWEKNLSPWDTSAGSVIVSEAGGQVTNYLGQEFVCQMNSVLATNGHIHEALLQETQVML